MDTDVLVVGAGPSGLALAVVLAEYGVDFRVVDRKSGPVEQSRAALVHVRTIELLDRMGLAGRALERGLRITRIEIFERGRRAGEFPLAGAGVEGLTPFPFALGLEQERTERLLVERLAELGAEVEWDSELVDLSITAHEVEGRGERGVSAVVKHSGVEEAVRARGVSAVVKHSGVGEVVRARWVVGADGAASRVRHALGLEFAGSTFPQTGFLADVELDTADIAPQTVRLNLTRGGFVGMFPLHHKRYRLFGAVAPGQATATDTGAHVTHEAFAQTSLAEIQRWFDEFFMIPARVLRVDWSSLFRTHSRLSRKFRTGPAFLIGDAAHIHSPAGGQGMNLGIGDAVNLGWKLAMVARGQAAPELLDSYEAERRPVAEAVLRNADRGFRLESTANPIVAWTRTNILARLIGPLSHLAVVRNAVFRLFSQTWISYPNGPRAPHVPELHDVVGGLRHHLLLFEGSRPDPAIEAYRQAAAAVLARYQFTCDIQVVPTKLRTAHEAYGATTGRVVLIRPDGHVGYAGGLADLGELVRYLDKLTGRAGRT